jgi:1,4-dihydroxy-2-naphthoate octaprenyltransferase
MNFIEKTKIWIIASRPKTLPAAFSPVIVGSAVAHFCNSFKLTFAILALLVSLFIQIGTNFVNDLFDFRKGTDKKDRVGPERFLTTGIVTEKQVINAIIISFGIAFISGIFLVFSSNWILLAVGILSILAGISYTAGPFPLAYNGFGDIFVFIFFGFVGTIGTFYVQTHSISQLSILASIPIGALITNILVVNNYRDIEDDKLANKRTLIVVFGRNFAKIQYVFLIMISYLSLIYIYFLMDFELTIFLPFLSLPIAISLIKQIYQVEGKQLNLTLAKTAQFSVLFSLLFAISFIL